VGVEDRVFEAEWSELGARKQWEQVNGKRSENRWEWVRRVCLMRKRERVISTRHFGCCEDGHGIGELLSSYYHGSNWRNIDLF